MLKTFKVVYKLRSSISSNTYIYYLQKIPLIGKLFKDKLYSLGKAKLTFSIIASIFGFIKSAIGQFLYFGLFFLLPIILLKGITPDDIYEGGGIYANDFLRIFIFLNIILGARLQHKLVSSYSNVTDTVLLYMRLNPRDYFLSKAIFGYIRKTALLLPAFLILGWVFDIGATVILIFYSELMAVRIFYDGIYALPIKRAKRQKYFYKTWQWSEIVPFVIYYLICFGLSYLPLKFEIIATNRIISGLPELFSSYFGIVFFAVLALLGVFFIRRYSDYDFLKREEIAEGETAKKHISNAGNSQAVLKDGKLNYDINPRIESKRGHEYLNAVFMSRYRKMFRKRAYITAAASFLIIVGGGLAELYFNSGMFESVIKNVGIWFFLIYLLAFKDQYTLALFNNIDRFMLTYSWYRSPDAIIKSYLIRLKSSFGMNAIMTLPMVIGLTISSLILGIEFMKFAPLIGIIVMLTLFYSMHYLTLYYLVQPYTEQARIKSPVYSILNTLVYIVSYGAMRMDDVGTLFLVSVSVVIVVYLVVSVLLLKKVSPKSFRIR